MMPFPLSLSLFLSHTYSPRISPQSNSFFHPFPQRILIPQLKMKRMDIFCASQAATSICLSMDQLSSSSPSLLGGGGGTSPAIDRHNPIIRDSRRNAAAVAANPLPPLSLKNRTKKKNNKGDQSMKTDGRHKETVTNGSSSSNVSRKSWSCTRPGEFISPPDSTRYLLSEKVLLNALSDLEPPGLKIFPAETSKTKDVDKIINIESKPSPPPSSAATPDQVVVLRVSLHCRGCERKMRKHISSMEGVRSFNIDFAAKKVTVAGNVTPLEVLSSISKVKNAQLWGPSIAEFKSYADKGSFVGLAS